MSGALVSEPEGRALVFVAAFRSVRGSGPSLGRVAEEFGVDKAATDELLRSLRSRRLVSYTVGFDSLALTTRGRRPALAWLEAGRATEVTP